MVLPNYFILRAAMTSVSTSLSEESMVKKTKTFKQLKKSYEKQNIFYFHSSYQLLLCALGGSLVAFVILTVKHLKWVLFILFLRVVLKSFYLKQKKITVIIFSVAIRKAESWHDIVRWIFKIYAIIGCVIAVAIVVCILMAIYFFWAIHYLFCQPKKNCQ